MSTKLHGVTSHKILVRDIPCEISLIRIRTFSIVTDCAKHNTTLRKLTAFVTLCCVVYTQRRWKNFWCIISDISHVAPFSVNCMVRIVPCSQEPAALFWAILMLPVRCHQMLPDINSVIILPHAPTAVVESRWHIPPKRWYLSTKQHCFTSQKVAFFISAVMRVLNFAKPFFGQPNFYHLHDLRCECPLPTTLCYMCAAWYTEVTIC